MKDRRVALYCRVDGAADAQNNQQLLSMQRSALEACALEQGLQIAGCYEDAGYAGHDLTRPGLNQMLEDWKAGIFDAVLVASRTRLFRGSVFEEPKWPFPILAAS